MEPDEARRLMDEYGCRVIEHLHARIVEAIAEENDVEALRLDALLESVEARLITSGAAVKITGLVR